MLDPYIRVVAADLVSGAKVFVQGCQAFLEGDLPMVRKTLKILKAQRARVKRGGPELGLCYYILTRKTLGMNVRKLRLYRNMLLLAPMVPPVPLRSLT